MLPWLVLLACHAPSKSPSSPPAEEPAEDSGGNSGGDSGTEPWPEIARITRPDSISVRADGRWALSTGFELFEIGRAFYTEHPDAYDLLLVWTEAEVADLWAFTIPLDHSIQGIGLGEVMTLYGWDDLSPADAGSAGALQAIVLMNAPSLYAQASRFSAQDILTHEVGHRWSANLSLPGASDPGVLTDAWWSHWGVFAHVGGPSATGYGQLLDEGEGRFRYEIHTPLVYSDLELYQQGLLAPDEVGELFYVEEATGFDPPDYYGQPWTNDAYGVEVRFSGQRVDFTMEEILAAHGPRIPSHEEARAQLRMGFVLVCEAAEGCSEEALAWVDQQRMLWEETFFVATRGRAGVDTRLE